MAVFFDAQGCEAAGSVGVAGAEGLAACGLRGAAFADGLAADEDAFELGGEFGVGGFEAALLVLAGGDLRLGLFTLAGVGGDGRGGGFDLLLDFVLGAFVGGGGLAQAFQPLFAAGEFKLELVGLVAEAGGVFALDGEAGLGGLDVGFDALARGFGGGQVAADLLLAGGAGDEVVVDLRDLAEEQALLYRDRVLDGAGQAYQAAERGYTEGKASYLDLLEARRVLTETRIEYAGILLSYREALARLELATGAELE